MFCTSNEREYYALSILMYLILRIYMEVENAI